MNIIKQKHIHGRTKDIKVKRVFYQDRIILIYLYDDIVSRFLTREGKFTVYFTGQIKIL